VLLKKRNKKLSLGDGAQGQMTSSKKS